MDKILQEIQDLLKKGYEEYFKIESHCKSSEGYIYVKENFPVYWDYGKSSTWEVGVYSYALGPSRMHEFEGKTKEEALNKALVEVKKWVNDLNVAKGEKE